MFTLFCRVENISNDVAYTFNGEGYAVRSRVLSGPYNRFVFGVSISFKTYDENAILFLAIDPDNVSHLIDLLTLLNNVIYKILLNLSIKVFGQ